jgi:hypothetical protein
MPANRQLALKVTALGAQVISVLREVKSPNADELQRCLDALGSEGASQLDALRKIETMCSPKWLGDDYLAAVSRSDWDEMLESLRKQANAAADSVFQSSPK